MTKLKWYELGEDNVYFDNENDPILKECKNAEIKKESGFTWDISRILQKIPYSGSSTQQEMRELESLMRELIEEGKYSYKYIENFLISLNYNLNKIRRTFKKLTGVDPEIYLDNQPYLDTPPSIPQINYGWGKSKDKSYDYYFIMPFNNKYCIFGQKGDIDREIVSEHYDLESALKALEKLVKEVMKYDRVLTKKDLIDSKRIHVPEDMPMGIKIAKENETFKEDPLINLLDKEEFVDEKTPNEFFEETYEEDPSSIVDAIRSIFDYVESLNIPEYTITIKDLMYRSKEGSIYELQPEVEGVEIQKTVFETTAYFVVVMVFKRNQISKKGLVVFIYNPTKGILETKGIFKGEDGKLYGLNKEGLDKYFNL